MAPRCVETEPQFSAEKNTGGQHRNPMWWLFVTEDPSVPQFLFRKLYNRSMQSLMLNNWDISPDVSHICTLHQFGVQAGLSYDSYRMLPLVNRENKCRAQLDGMVVGRIALLLNQS